MPFSLGFWANSAVRRLTTWTKYSIGLAQYWRAAAYCNLAAGKFFIFGAGTSGITGNATAYRSTLDGITWTARAMPASKVWVASAASTTRIIALENSSGTVWYSDNGTSWTTTNSTAGAPTFFAVWDGSRFMFGDSTSVRKIWYSSDAITWSSVVPSGSGTGTYIQAITFDGAGNYMAIHQATTTTNHFKCTGDPTVSGNWTTTTLPSSSAWAGLAYGNNTWVAVRSASVAYAYSTNFGTTWTSGTLPYGFETISSNLQKISFIAGKFVYQSYNGTNWYLVSSSDGISWTSEIIKVTSNRITGSAWASSPAGDMAIGVVMQENSAGTDLTSDEYILGA